MQHATVVHSRLGYRLVSSKQLPLHHVAFNIRNAYVLVSGISTVRSLS